MLNVILFKDLVDGKSTIDLPEKLVRSAFTLLLIGYATGDGSWAQGSYNWAYSKCDSIINSCRSEKLNISAFLSVLCAAAKVHGNLYITAKGDGYNTIASSHTDAYDGLMRMVTDDKLKSSAYDITELCTSCEGEITELHAFAFSSLCAHILNALYPFFIEYDVNEIFGELKGYLESINNNSRALERYDAAVKKLNTKYKFK